MNEVEIAEIFKKNKFRATPQRIAVYKYLCENRTHPDADEIFKSVVKTHPSFSKTTVYNSLQALEEQGLVVKVSIDTNRIRYDAGVSSHGHFICTRCNKIFDFEIDKSLGECQSLNDFCVSKRDVYYSGLCPECK